MAVVFSFGKLSSSFIAARCMDAGHSGSVVQVTTNRSGRGAASR